MNCLYCNKPIEGKRNTKRYCGNTCKQYAYLKRSFSIPSDSLSISLSEPENSSNPKEHFQNINNTYNKPTAQHVYRKQVTQQEYQYINADILDRIQGGYVSLTITSDYFTNQNTSAFAYIIPRIRCIIENLFQLSYKRKLYYKTAITICRAVEEMLLPEHIGQLPCDFPFLEDLKKMREQFIPMANYLKEDKEGVKFRLTKSVIVRYILILNLLRNCTKKEPFMVLFPELYKSNTPAKPNTVAA
ncbi:MAG: hypothetical protein HY062_02015 [Bacteroidetes bacterium]|nr:hypothetical protein [Bacteroidota bacterium]